MYRQMFKSDTYTSMSHDLCEKNLLLAKFVGNVWQGNVKSILVTGLIGKELLYPDDSF